ncbi:MAG: hypothetical protein IJY73_00390 [Oscillospiraceae bacterium]|nr:hypothetical protein [Oscillospiraceae bacterium]
MSFTENFGKVMNDLDKGFDDLADKAKEKLDEHLTDEKKAEYKEKANEAMNNAEESITRLGKTIGKELKDLFGSKSEEK